MMMRRACVALCAAVAFSFAIAPETSRADEVPFVEKPSGAQAGSPENPQNGGDMGRSQAFRAVTGPRAEQVPGGALLIGGYGVFLAFILLYVWRIGRLQRTTAAEVARLRASFERATTGSAATQSNAETVSRSEGG